MLASWYRRYRRRGLVVIGITELASSPAEVKRTARQRGLAYPILIDRGARIFRRYGLDSHPTTILIDRQGRIVRVEIGYVRGDDRAIAADMLPLLRTRAGDRR